MSFLAHRLSRRWIAGDSLESAIRAAKQANNRGIKPLLNYMGEHYRNKLLVEQSIGIYLELLERLREEVKAGLSLKLTQLGLLIGKGYCLRNLEEVVGRAQELGVFVWIDMEAPHLVQDSLDIYHDLFKQCKNMGITLQANLRRTRADLLHLLEKNGKVRLVKGAYKGDVGGWEQIELNYSRLLRLLFSRGNYFALGTSDEILIDETKILAERYQREWEFQLLRGVKKNLKRRLLREGFQVAEYTPFGPDVLPYLWRRFKEHPGIIFKAFQ